ncbi:MAG: carbohydrate kinase family protein [Bacteroidota bacterium]
MNIPPLSPLRDLDVIVAGLSVVDIIGRPLNLRRPPKRGGLEPVETITMTTGGNVPNVGIDLVQLGFKVGAVSRVGNDSIGGFVRSRLEMSGIMIGGLVVDDRKQTSATVVAVDRSGERTFFHARGCMENFRVEDVLEQMDIVRRGRILAFGYFGLLPECDEHLGRLFRAVKQKTGMAILLDTAGNPRKDDATLASFLPHVDFFIPSYDEAKAMTGKKEPADMIRAFRAAGATGVVGVKLGADGCIVSVSGKTKRIAVRRVRRVVDATGAGDAFIAGFLAGMLNTLDPFAAARLGNAVAASSLTAVGASTAVRPLHTYLHS